MDHHGREGGKLQIPMAALSITGTISQSALNEILNESRVSDAITGRFLFAMPPEQPRQWSDDDVSDETIENYEQMILDLSGTAGAAQPLRPRRTTGSELGCRSRVAGTGGLHGATAQETTETSDG